MNVKVSERKRIPFLINDLQSIVGTNCSVVMTSISITFNEIVYHLLIGSLLETLFSKI
jgi:hypothetical protein